MKFLLNRKFTDIAKNFLSHIEGTPQQRKKWSFDMNFTDKLNLLMEKKNIRISDLSRGSGIPYTTIDGFYKKGYNNIKLSTLRQLSEYFGVSIDYLVNDNCDIKNSETDSEENDLLIKYRCLDDKGKQEVSAVLETNYERVTRPVLPYTEEDDFINIPYFEDRAAAGSGYMLGEGNYEMMKVARSRKTERADFIVTVSGSSMEPEYFDGDNVLVHSQPDVYVGEIGIFVVNGDGYIKQKGKNRLISLNKKYKDVYVNEYDNIYCAGKVVGKLEDDEILS